MQIALISQPFGQGDHIFAMGVARHIMDQGYKIMWPVKEQFLDGNYDAYPDITFVNEVFCSPKYLLIKEDCIVDSMRIIPIRWSDSILHVDSKLWMRSKYDLYNLDYKEWKSSANYVRNIDKENHLFHIYGIEKGEKYNLINGMFRSNFTGNICINPENGFKNVEMRIIPGYSLFDYSLLIQNAETIHAVNSAIFYLLELLELKASEVHLYSRIPDEIGFPYTDYLQTKTYILHT